MSDTFQPDQGPGNDHGTYDPLVDEQEQSFELRSFYLGFIRQFKEVLIAQIRAFFENNPRASCFLDDQGNSKVHVVEAFGDEKRLFPSVVVQRTDGVIQDLFLASRLGTIYSQSPDGKREQIGFRQGGKLKFNVTLQVGAFNTTTRDSLFDLLAYALVGPLHWSLMAVGIDREPNSVSIGAESVENVEKLGQAIYTRGLTVAFLSEWYDDFFYNGVTITDILIETNKTQLGG